MKKNISYSFKYLPLSGPLPGEAFKLQTEQVLSEIGNTTYENKELADEALAASNDATKVAYEAQKSASEAKTEANIALERVDIVNNHFINLEQNITNVEEDINVIATEITNVKNIALTAENKANDNFNAITVINEAVSSQLINLDEIEKNISTALAITNENQKKLNVISEYKFTSEKFDLNVQFETSRYYVKNVDALNLPVKEEGLLDVDISEVDSENVDYDRLIKQRYLSFTDYKVYCRQGKVFFNNYQEESFVQWTEWIRAAGNCEFKENKNLPLGYAGLDEEGKIPLSLLPAVQGQDTYEVNVQCEPWVSEEITLDNTILGTEISIEHGLIVEEINHCNCEAAIICKNADKGYVAGEIVTQIATASTDWAMIPLKPELTDTTISVRIGTNGIIVLNAQGNDEDITLRNWKLIFKIWKPRKISLNSTENVKRNPTLIKYWQSENLTFEANKVVVSKHDIANFDVNRAIARAELVCIEDFEGYTIGETVTQIVTADNEYTISPLLPKLTETEISVVLGSENVYAIKKDGTMMYPYNTVFALRFIITYAETAESDDGINEGDFILLVEKGKANGVATLDSDGKIPKEQLPTEQVSENALESLPVGSVIMSLSNVVPDGFLELNGESVSRSIYPQLWEYVNASSNIITEEIWQEYANTHSSVGSFSYGDESTTFRLPKITDYPRGGAGNIVGEYYGDAIRNITGAIYSTNRGGIEGSNGVFYGSSYSQSRAPLITDGGSYKTIGLDVSRSVPTANENRPKTIIFKFLIKAYGVINSANINTAELADTVAENTTLISDLNQKIKELSLSNVTNLVGEIKPIYGASLGGSDSKRLMINNIIHEAWAVCDGTNGTPDLSGKFLRGTVAEAVVGQTGGEESIVLSLEQLPTHSHTVENIVQSTGSHIHDLSGSTASSGSHTHRIAVIREADYTGHSSVSGLDPVTSATTSGIISTDGAHTHNISASITAAGEHSHTVTTIVDNTGGSQPYNNLPPYLTILYFMYTG